MLMMLVVVLPWYWHEDSQNGLRPKALWLSEGHY